MFGKTVVNRCYVCKRRKIKAGCDTKKPSCTQCIKGNFECKRDDTDLIFQFSSSSTRKKVEDDVALSRKKHVVKNRPGKVKVMFNHQSPENKGEKVLDQEICELQESRQIKDFSQPPVLQYANYGRVYKQNILDQLRAQFIPPLREHSLDDRAVKSLVNIGNNYTGSANGVTTLRSLFRPPCPAVFYSSEVVNGERSVLLEEILLAVSLSICAREVNDDRIMYGGLRRYSRAITMLRKRLETNNDWSVETRNEILMAQGLCAMFEYNGTNGNVVHLLNHLKGATRLVTYKGTYQRSSVAQDLLWELRLVENLMKPEEKVENSFNQAKAGPVPLTRVQFIFHLRCRRSSNLAKVNWLENVTSSLPLYGILDEIAILPNLLYEFDHTLPNNRTHLLLQLQSTLDIKSRIQNWRKGLDERITGQGYLSDSSEYYFSMPSTFSNQDRDPEEKTKGKLFPTTFQFYDSMIADALITWEGITIQLVSHITRLILLLSSSMSRIPERFSGFDKYSSAVRTCQHMEWFFDSRQASIGPLMVLMPLYIVKDTFNELHDEWEHTGGLEGRDCKRELLWVDMMGERMRCAGYPLFEAV
ncbi:MAG: hypothetical protein M1834_001775 [Cirrosporium novae-zelandiae]|nr:MAG: hypothetical protein M1834_001775 [Cirrosporium novae-zelandiae]